MSRKSATATGLSLTLSVAFISIGPAPGQAAAGRPVAYLCDDGTRVTARFLGPYRAVLSIGRREVPLRNTLAASGSRYEGSGITFWLKGDEAMLERPQGRSTNCRVAR